MGRVRGTETPMSDRRELADGGWIELHEGFAPDHARLMQRLVATLPLRVESIVMFGKSCLTPRLSSWHGDPGCAYRYSGRTFEPEPWTSELAELRERVSAAAGVPLNSVLVSYYRDGRDSMGAHSDDERELGPRPDDKRIASLSLGARRRFLLRHRVDPAERHRFDLGHGDLLVMGGALQRHYRHRVPRTKRPVEPRLNLTFRHIVT